ncbi:MAG TPA: nuclear transport factor 2 family protein [Candidatus Acidoferrum sp.]|nr:nuclear transport factor 2 family protein [Candidatus Acidoferrum sp.]
MGTNAEAWEFAEKWIAAWNAHDLEVILTHYAENVRLTSPAAAKLLQLPSGTIERKEKLRGYFKRGLEAYPNLKFDLLDVLSEVSSVVIYFKNQIGTRTAEFMEFGEDGKVARVVANYGA